MTPTHRADVPVRTGTPSQVAHPWRATVRTVLWAVVAFAAMAPLIYQAATEQDPAAAAGWAGTALAVLAGVQRVMTLPAVDGFLRLYAPWLAALPAVEHHPTPVPDRQVLTEEEIHAVHDDVPGIDEP